MKLFSPAKINLFLHILGKRPDGYHNLVTLMCCVGLYDIVRLDFSVRDVSVACNHPLVPLDHTNLACRAAKRFFDHINRKEGVGISIEKQIPVGAGLGGGSSNAATVLLGLNRFYGLPLSREQLIALGVSIGADVPFFIDQKPAIASGVGEILEPCSGIEPYTVLLVFPGFSISTAEMFKNFNFRLTKDIEKIKIPFFRNRNFDIKRDLHNDFEKIAEEKHPELASIKNVLLKHGAMGALMTGSGSAVFGLYRDRESAEKAYSTLCRHEGRQLFVADVIL
ncbi:MAG: 4-(cytidine 5'-diphospho)-2-C-methyl-D-erythritol kinase [Thermodesulfobacteriota bacterium]